MKDYSGQPIVVKRSPNGDTFATLPLELAVELRDELTHLGVKSAIQDPTTTDRRDERAETTLGFGNLSVEQSLALQGQIDDFKSSKVS